MANEITINISAQLQNPSTASTGGLRDQFTPGALKFTQATAAKSDQVVTTSVSDTAVTVTGLSSGSYGWLMLSNLDSTNSVDWGPTVAGAIAPIGTLGPGGGAIIQMKANAALRLQAAAGTPKVRVQIWGT